MVKNIHKARLTFWKNRWGLFFKLVQLSFSLCSLINVNMWIKA